MQNNQKAPFVAQVGWSAEKNTDRAAGQALSPLSRHRGELGLVLAYASPRHDLGRVHREVRKALGEVPILGCTTSGEMNPEGLTQGGLVLIGLDRSQMRVGVGHGEEVFRDPARAGREAVQRAREALERAGGSARSQRLCLFHTAGFTLDQPGVEEDMAAAITEALGSGWLVAGASAADDNQFLGSSQLCGDRVLSRAVVLALVETDLRLSHGMAHGFAATDRRVLVTAASGSIVRELDGIRPLDRYAELIGVTPGKLTAGLSMVRTGNRLPKGLLSFSQKLGLTPQKITDNFAFFKYSIENPFGLPSADGSSTIAKVPRMITPEGYLEFHTRIPEGTALMLMRLDPRATLDASSRAIGQVEAELGGHAQVLLVFECLGRAMYLHRELDGLARAVREKTRTPMAGFFSAAEQGSLDRGPCLAHNYTASVIGLG